ncbi:hypothetical protein SERLA73DRAFT_150036 [Serpula lacrymans var. lacrymans S7.3]|uniref:Uncharacterized protein n=1 Tax=Serpula lacrymans var. lacrymans (strain S7.3) TaxID=936435 RepID=F8PKU0_SERL3|nr:hypothetical protein SERLA73DRAFT_150036 [Serpula lacrymans var. lacrymans S7.3]
MIPQGTSEVEIERVKKAFFRIFQSHEELEHNLSSPQSNCGQWLADADPEYDSDYCDDPETALDMVNDPGDDSQLYGSDSEDDEYENLHGGTEEEHSEAAIPVPMDVEPDSNARHVDEPAVRSRDAFGITRDCHPNKSSSWPGGRNYLQKMDEDIFVHIRKENLHYPFTSQEEWGLANRLSLTSLSQQKIDTFLRLDNVKQQDLCYTTARDIQTQIESLPDVPHWKHVNITVGPYKTKRPITLYYREGIEVVDMLFSNPVFTSSMDMEPYRLYEQTERGEKRAYDKFMSGELAWDLQSSIPSGNTLVGIITASDKTPLTVGTGNLEMHPVLLSLANIHPSV